MIRPLSFLLVSVFSLAAITTVAPAVAQDFPARPVRILPPSRGRRPVVALAPVEVRHAG